MTFYRIRDIAVIVIFLFLATLLIFLLRGNRSSLPSSYLVLQLPTEEVDTLPDEVKELVGRINMRNQAVSSFLCSYVRISFPDRRLLRVNGEINYKKDRYFRMLVRSVGGVELDIGSNDTNFWFWSKRMVPSALYYSSYDNLHCTRLKTPFHPVWLKGILGFDPIDIQRAMARKRGSYWEIISRSQNMQNRPILRSTLIDPQNMAIIGHYIYDQGNLVCSAEVHEHSFINECPIPAKMVIRWHEEAITMIWQLRSQCLNVNFDSRLWQMPSISPKVDIGKPLLSEL